MSWRVVSDRMPWPSGTVLDVAGLAGCNIGALVQGGHLVPVPDQPNRKRKPVGPATDTANEPEEL